MKVRDFTVLHIHLLRFGDWVDDDVASSKASSRNKDEVDDSEDDTVELIDGGGSGGTAEQLDATESSFFLPSDLEDDSSVEDLDVTIRKHTLCSCSDQVASNVASGSGSSAVLNVDDTTSTKVQTFAERFICTTYPTFQVKGANPFIIQRATDQ